MRSSMRLSHSSVSLLLDREIKEGYYKFEIYAHIPSSASPEPPMVIGKFDNAVDAEVAITKSKRPRYGPTVSISTINDTPCRMNAKNVIAIPTAKVLPAVFELKFSLLIRHKSAIAVLMEMIDLCAFSLGTNL